MYVCVRACVRACVHTYLRMNVCKYLYVLTSLFTTGTVFEGLSESIQIQGTVLHNYDLNFGIFYRIINIGSLL